MELAGGCRCGAVRYIIAADALPRSYACHCHQCQRWSGSAFSQNAIVPEPSLRVSGPIAVYEFKTEDRTSTQRMCAVCHTRIFNTNTRRPGMAIVRAGTLDRSEELSCVLHIYTASRQAWVAIPADVPAFAGAAPADALHAALFGSG